MTSHSPQPRRPQGRLETPRMHGQWINFCYHYGVGGAFFLFTMKMLYSGGALKWERPSDRLVTKGLCAGILTFALIHIIWISVVV